MPYEESLWRAGADGCWSEVARLVGEGCDSALAEAVRAEQWAAGDAHRGLKVATQLTRQIFCCSARTAALGRGRPTSAPGRWVCEDCGETTDVRRELAERGAELAGTDPDDVLDALRDGRALSQPWSWAARTAISAERHQRQYVRPRMDENDRMCDALREGISGSR